MDDLRSRLEDRPQISTDGLKAYVEAIEGAFGGDVDFAQVIKEYGKLPGEDNERLYSPPACTSIEKRRVEGNPDMRKANTSYVERSTLTMRMGNRKFTRLTNAFSKKLEKHAAMVSLFFLHYNFCRIHKTLGVTPAMEAGVTDKLRDMEWIVGLIDARASKLKRPKTYRKAAAQHNRSKAMTHFSEIECPVCGGPARDITPPDLDGQAIHCKKCEKYKITGTVKCRFSELCPELRADALRKAKRWAEPGDCPVISTKTI